MRTITQIAISGYRSLRDVTLSLDALNVVTGANGAGKSSLYRALRQVWPSPVVALNRAVALAMADGPGAGLAAIGELERDGRLAGYRYLPAAKADLLRRLGRAEEAAQAYRRLADEPGFLDEGARSTPAPGLGAITASTARRRWDGTICGGRFATRRPPVTAPISWPG